MLNELNRRGTERFAIPAAYSTVTVQPAGDTMSPLFGHAYDISETGARIELDQRLDPGTSIRVAIQLPYQDVPINIDARVVWVMDDEDDPGPVRCAVTFDQFATHEDRRRLFLGLLNGGLRRAA